MDRQMMGRDKPSGPLAEEGLSVRDVALTLAEALSAVGLTSVIVDQIGPAGVLAFPPLMWVFWRSLRADPEVSEADWLPAVAEGAWLADARASAGRGTHISTLAVRYDVDPDWLESELSRFAPTPRV